MKKTAAQIIGILVSCIMLKGAEPHQFIINLNPSDGIPNINISGICQDSFNRIWIGTKRGVYYYTGYGFIALQNKDYISTCSSNTSMIAIDDSNCLWIFTDNGSGYYDIREGVFTSIPQLMEIHVTDVDFDMNGDAWITSSEGILKYSVKSSSLSKEISNTYLTPYKSCLYQDSEIVFTAKNDNLYFYNIENQSLRAVRVKNVSSLSLIEKSGDSEFVVLDGDTKTYLLHTPPYTTKKTDKTN